MVIPFLAPGVVGFRMLANLEQKLLGSHSYSDEIVKGMDGNVTTEMGLLIGDLADTIRAVPELRTLFETAESSDLTAQIAVLKGPSTFQAQWQAFVDRYGVRTAGEIDIARKRWQEDPQPLIRSILAIVATARPGQHREEYQVNTAKAERNATELIRAERIAMPLEKTGPDALITTIDGVWLIVERARDIRMARAKLQTQLMRCCVPYRLAATYKHFRFPRKDQTWRLRT